MSWWVIGAMAVGAYAFKALGVFGLSRVQLSGPLANVVGLLPAALFTGLVVQQVLAAGNAELVITRALGVAAGGIAVWRRAPLLVVIVVSAGVAAATRAIF